MSAKICSQCGHNASDDARFCPSCGTPFKAPAAAPPGDPLVGAVLADRYKVIEKIGQGNAGTVYRAEQTAIGKKVAVKVLGAELAKDAAAVDRFRREATTVAGLDSEHIVSVIDFGHASDGRLFYAMEHLEGESMADAIKRDGQLDPDRVLYIVYQIAEVLAEAHGAGLVHRDLRPRSVMLVKKRGKSDFVKLLDFGLSKLVLPSDPKPGQASTFLSIADPRYLAPELLRGEGADRRADIYALGAIAYEALAGVAPYEGKTPPAILGKLLGKIPSVREKRRDVPEWLDQVIATCMERTADKRFITAVKLTSCLDEERAPAADDLSRSAALGAQVPDRAARAAPSGHAVPQEPAQDRGAGHQHHRRHPRTHALHLFRTDPNRRHRPPNPPGRRLRDRRSAGHLPCRTQTGGRAQHHFLQPLREPPTVHARDRAASENSPSLSGH